MNNAPCDRRLPKGMLHMSTVLFVAFGLQHVLACGGEQEARGSGAHGVPLVHSSVPSITSDAVATQSPQDPDQPTSIQSDASVVAKPVASVEVDLEQKPESVQPSWFQRGAKHRQVAAVKWLEEHGATEVQDIGSICFRVGEFGVPPMPSIMCVEQREPSWLKDGSLLYIGKIWALQGRRLSVVFFGPVAAGPSDPMPADAFYYVKLLPTISANGSVLKLSDDPECSCDDAERRLKEYFPDDNSILDQGKAKIVPRSVLCSR
ncbi:MAG: hypothetical protein QM784_30385 [Polyangiaceae bacterium]